MSFGRMSWEKPEDPGNWNAAGESAEVDVFWPQWKPLAESCWWNLVLESDWSSEEGIIAACGPEYLMWQDMYDFGNEVDFFSRPSIGRSQA